MNKDRAMIYLEFPGKHRKSFETITVTDVRERIKERREEIETAKARLAKLKTVISWKTLVITKKFMKSPRKHEAEVFARNYKIMAHQSIDKKIAKMNVTKSKVELAGTFLITRIMLNNLDTTMWTPGFTKL